MIPTSTYKKNWKIMEVEASGVSLTQTRRREFVSCFPMHKAAYVLDQSNKLSDAGPNS